MKYSSHAPRWLVKSHKAMMRQIEEPVVNQKLFDKIMGPALSKIAGAERRAKLEKWGNSLERQEQIDWFKRPAPIDAFADGAPGNDLLILGVLVRADIEWMCPIWEMLREKEDDFDDAGQRLYSASVSAYMQAGSDKADLRHIIEEQASRLPPAGDEYLAGEVPLPIGRDESLRPHAEPTQAELESLLKHPDSRVSGRAWRSLSTYQRKIYEDTTGDNPISREGSKHNHLMDLVSGLESARIIAADIQELKKSERNLEAEKQERIMVERDMDAKKKGIKDASDKGGKTTSANSKEKAKHCQDMVIPFLHEKDDFFMSKPDIAKEIHKKLVEENYNGGDIPAESTICDTYLVNSPHFQMPSNQERMKMERAAREKARKEVEAAKEREKSAKVKAAEDKVKAKVREHIKKIISIGNDSLFRMPKEAWPQYIQEKLLTNYKERISLKEIKEHLTHL